VIDRMLLILGKDWSASVSNLVGTEHHKVRQCAFDVQNFISLVVFVVVVVVVSNK
jgi:hypothetical protein